MLTAEKIDATIDQQQATRSINLHCTQCNRVIFDGEFIKTRGVRVTGKLVEAKCKRCGGWTPLPLVPTYEN